MQTYGEFNQSEKKSNGGWAVFYAAEKGWAVFPTCWPDSEGKCACGGGHEGKEIGKAPLRTVSHGWRCATRDLNVIREWWTRWPQANIGVALSSSDPPLLVVDLDGPEAVQEALRLGLPPGPVSYTGRGQHRFYKAPAGDYANGVHKGTSWKIEVLVNGYVVVPPSKHRFGKVYVWDEGLGPDEPLQDAPAWAVGYLGKPVVRGAVSLPAELPPIELHEIRVSPRIKELIQKDAGDEYPSRSETQCAVISAMVEAGHTDLEIAAIIWRYPVGEKAREQGLKWLMEDIARVRKKVEAENESKIKARRDSQATRLIKLARGHAELFATPEGEPFATVDQENHRETLPVESTTFRDWLGRLFYKEYRKSPGRQAIEDALAVLRGEARWGGLVHSVFTRVASAGGSVWVDLGDPAWRAVEIKPEGWRIVQTCPVKFRRPRGMLALPDPEPGGSLDLLWQLINVQSDQDRILVPGWLIASLRPHGPYLILILQSEQGTGKTFQAKVLRTFLDPNEAAIRTVPREERDLIIAARNSWVLNFDNLSGVPVWLSDALCRIASGGGFGTRKLYQDLDEIVVDVCRPVILNGIGDLTQRDDLRDRSIVITPPPIKAVRNETELWELFQQIQPKILGVLLDAVSTALRNANRVGLDSLPRMADATTWVTAAESALGWKPGTFYTAYLENRQAVAMASLTDNPLAQAIIALANRSPWTGTATDLLSRLEYGRSERELKDQAWPKNPEALANRLRRLAPSLRRAGVEVDFTREPGSGHRLVTLTFRRNVDQTAGVTVVTAHSQTVTGKKGLQNNVSEGCDSCDRFKATYPKNLEKKEERSNPRPHNTPGEEGSRPSQPSQLSESATEAGPSCDSSKGGLSQPSQATVTPPDPNNPATWPKCRGCDRLVPKVNPEGLCPDCEAVLPGGGLS